MRDSMNNALKKAKIDLIVVTIAKTQKGNIKKDEKWHKIVIHSLKTEIFNTKTEMENLKTE